MSAQTDIDVAICTFRRAHITETLQSIAAATVPDGHSLRVIVVDNDDTPSAQERVKAINAPFPVTYVHAPGRNISIARNACLDAATAPILIFIDDDELVSPHWLEAMIAEQAASGAQVVLGPAHSIYDDNAPEWMREQDFHSSRPIYVNGEILTGYGCNTLLMREAPSVAGQRFSEDLGRTGGEDTIFLANIHQQGGTISYASNADVTEVVLPQRATLGWLLQRKFRFGQTHALMLQGTGGTGRLREVPKAFGKILVCAVMALCTISNRPKSMSWLLRATLHAGVVFQFLGGRPAEIYGKDQPT